MTSNVVLITGCSTGIGHSTATLMSRRGYRVYATARNLDDISDLERAGCRILDLDVTDEGSMRSAVEEVEAAEGGIGVLINNAGYSQSGAVENVPLEKVRKQFETNVFGLVRMCQLVLPGMRERGSGRIINLSSMGGKLTFPGGGYYHSTKYAVEAISDALRFEVAGFGIEVVLIQPGIITTRFAGTATGSMDMKEGDYAEFERAVERITRDNYERGFFRRLGGGPEVVAEVILKAVEAERPRDRYPVTASAHLLIGLRKVMPDRVWDVFLRTVYPRPGR